MGHVSQQIYKMTAADLEREGTMLLAESLPPIMRIEIATLNAMQAAAYFALAQLRRDEERASGESA